MGMFLKWWLDPTLAIVMSLWLVYAWGKQAYEVGHPTAIQFHTHTHTHMHTHARAHMELRCYGGGRAWDCLQYTVYSWVLSCIIVHYCRGDRLQAHGVGEPPCLACGLK